MKNNSLLESFKNALEGIFYILKEHRNFRILCTIAFLVILSGFYFEFTLEKWLVLVLLIGVVLTTELLNTAIELLSDFVSQREINGQIKIIKDLSAGAVLLISIFSIIIGFILFFSL